MMGTMNKRTVTFIFILAALAGLLLGLRLFLTQKEAALKVVLVSPENLATNISVSAQIKIDFNRPLTSENEVSATLSPVVSLTPALANNNQTLVLNPQGPLSSSTEYTLTVVDSKNKTPWQSKFTTEKLQGNPRLPYEIEQFTKQNYPLLEFIPYITDNFFITYSGPLALQVTIKRGSQSAIAPLVLEWITSHGVDSSTHQIKYFTPAP